MIKGLMGLFAGLLIFGNSTAFAHPLPKHELIVSGLTYQARSAHPAASPPFLNVRIIDTVGVKLKVLRSIEHAVTDQANDEVHRAWNTPLIAFTNVPAAIAVYIVPESRLRQVLGNASGCHDSCLNLPGPIIIGWDGHPADLAGDLSHEMIEHLVDPQVVALNGWMKEPCDPVNEYAYMRDGWALADFVYPSWFATGSTGSWDFMRVLSHPLQLKGFAYQLNATNSSWTLSVGT